METNLQQLWQAVLGELELSLSKANFSTWFKDTFISNIENDTATIGVPSTFIREWLEKKYQASILKALQNLTQGQIKGIAYKIEAQKKSPPLPTKKAAEGKKIIEKEEKPVINKFGLNSKYTFSNFVVGKNNELAHAAAKAVAENPGRTYNPLFIYGGAGLGKTHLMQAIGNEVVEKNPNAKVLYFTCEKFMNDFINSVSSGQAKGFKDLYRSVDVLLVDDIQFLGGKEGTQEQFSHTFNDLHQNNKQIVLSSDRPPKAIPSLEDRLKSRFEWGMIADISLPDIETKTAILAAKAKEKNYDLDPDIINYVASSAQSNIRELEGALNRLIAFHELNNTRPTLDSAKKLLSGFASPYSGIKKSFTPKQIIHTVAAFYDITVDDIIGKCREKKLVVPRQIIMFLMREELKSSFPAIGQELGGRDHTTAMHAVEKIGQERDRDEKIRQDIELIKQKLYSL